MIELRCQNNKKFAEISAGDVALSYRCRTCSDIWGKNVTHSFPIWAILKALSNGIESGTVYPAGHEPAPEP